MTQTIERANAGDTILIESGHYKTGNIIIQKSIVLIGMDFPVLDGESKYEVFTVASADVTIEGFRIINTGRSSMEDKAAIKCLDAHNVIIRNNKLENLRLLCPNCHAQTPTYKAKNKGNGRNYLLQHSVARW